MKKKLKLHWLALLILISACNLKYFEDAEFTDITFDPSIAVTFGELSYTVSDLFEELNSQGSDIGSNSEGVVTLAYQKNLQSQAAADFLNVADQNFNGELPGNTNLTNPATTTVISVTEDFEFDLTQQDSEEYDSIYFDTGNFEFFVESDFNTTIDFTATFASLVKDGVVLEFSDQLSPSGSTAQFSESLQDYTGYFHLDSDGNPTSGKFLVTLAYDIIVEPGDAVASTDRISFDVGLRNTEFDKVYGNVGSKQLEINFDNVEFGFFDQFGDGAITFNNPLFTFVFDNSFGFPANVDFQNIAVETSDGQTINLQGAILNQDNIVAGPSIAEEGTTLTTELALNKDNSNIDQLLNAQPETLLIDVQTTSNPSSTSQYNFVSRESRLDVGVDIEIPLDLNIDGLRVTESLPFTPPENIDQAKGLLLRLISENEMPLSGLVEIEFLNANGSTVYTLDAQAVFDAAEVGINGRVSTPSRATTDFILDEDGILAIEDATDINLNVTISTTNADQGANVKLFDDYELNFTVAGQLDLALTSNEN